MEINRNKIGKTMVTAVFVLAVMFSAGTDAWGRTVGAVNNNVIKRFLLAMGANNGGKKRVKLQYAVSDAKSFINILEDMGGLQPEDGRLLMDPTRDAVFWEMERLKERVGKAKDLYQRVEVIFYYSGHSDEKHLLLDEDRITYKEFSDAINDIDADVKIAILDSCASGAFTRVKGGKKRNPFLMDDAYNMKGYAVMTSSSSNESSQESDRLAASFFTHYLVSGLRGAADVNRDGRVTLNEAYQYSFNETLEKTEKTISGPQHPNYNIQMSGTGDVVMTDIRTCNAMIRLAKDIGGKVFVHHSKKGLTAEINKSDHRVIELGLDAGKYRIITVLEKKVYETEVTLKQGQTLDVIWDNFEETDQMDTVARGDLKASQRRVFAKRGRKPKLFAETVTKFTSAYGKGAVLTGGKTGLNFNDTLTVGFCFMANVTNIDESTIIFSPEDLKITTGHPAYYGTVVEYTFPSKSMFNIRAGILIGAGEASLISDMFYIAEPEIGVTFNVSRKLRLFTGISYRIISVSTDQFAPFSFCFNVRWGK